MSSYSRIFIILTIALIFPAYAWSECILPENKSTSESVINLPSELHVNGDSHSGDILWDSGWILGASQKINCSTSGDEYLGYARSFLRGGVNDDEVETGIPGITLQVHYRNNASGGRSMVLPTSGIRLQHPQGAVTINGEYRIMLLRRGLITSGQSHFYGPVLIHRIGHTRINQLSFLNTQLKVVSVGCDLEDNNILVPLGKHDKSEFTNNIGSVTASKHFSIPLRCEPGTTIKLTMESANKSHFPGVVELDKLNGAADGVGVQLLKRDGHPITFGEKMEIVSMNQSKFLTIDFLARYYRTRKNITPGIANSTVTFTMTYR